jgi:hypothetical protein
VEVESFEESSRVEDDDICVHPLFAIAKGTLIDGLCK